MFSSNNTSPTEYVEALRHGGCILNLDDLSFVDKLPFMPELICFRYNPGTRGVGNAVIGKPQEAKFGLRQDQIVAAYVCARERGAKRFGLHTMTVTNEPRYRRIVATIEMLLRLCSDISIATGIRMEFVNMGGGIAIPYRPADKLLQPRGVRQTNDRVARRVQAGAWVCPKVVHGMRTADHRFARCSCDPGAQCNVKVPRLCWSGCQHV